MAFFVESFKSFLLFHLRLCSSIVIVTYLGKSLPGFSMFLQWTTASFDFPTEGSAKKVKMLAHCNLKQNMCLCSKQSSLFYFYALPSGGKSKDAVVHYLELSVFSFSLKNGPVDSKQIFYIKVYRRLDSNPNYSFVSSFVSLNWLSFLKNGPSHASF